MTLRQPNIDRLLQLGLSGMAEALEEQRDIADVDQLGFDDRLAMMIEREAEHRDHKSYLGHLRQAQLRIRADVQDIDCRAGRGIADYLWPALHGDLTGDEDGLASVALLDNLQQVAPALGGEALQPPVIEEQQGDPAQAAHQTIERAFVAGTGERRDQLGDAAIEDGLVLAAGLVGERAGDERLSRSRWPAQDQIVTLADPVAGGELGERGPGEPTIADAVLDRIVHNAYRIELKGESQRKRNKPPPLDGGDGNRAPA